MTQRLLPIRVGGISAAVMISAGADRSLALKSDGTVWAWGWNQDGQLGDGTQIDRTQPVQVVNLTDVVKVAAGDYHNLALSRDGTLWVWGSDTRSMLGLGTIPNRRTPGIVPNAFTISGTVKFGTTGVAGVGVTLSGDAIAYTLTDAAGNFAFPGLVAQRSYTVTSARSGYTFTPPQAVFNNLSANQTANFAAMPPGATHFASLSRSNMNFGAISGMSITTPQQEVVFSQTPAVNATWTASTSHPWLKLSSYNGTGAAKLQVSLVPSFLPTSGTHTATISFYSAGAAVNPITLPVTVNLWFGVSDPYGHFDSPADNAAVSSSIPITGWALDSIGVSRVAIYRDSVSGEPAGALIYIGDAVFIQDSRPDVETAYPNAPHHYRSGWGYMLLTNFLPNHGNGTFKLHAVATNAVGKSLELGTKTITVDNAHATKPFGAIDTPAQGATVGGSDFVNFGWALTPQPAKIPTDGSTIQVWLDGAPLGNVTYNNPRSDIDTLFPNYANTFGAVGFRYIDTAKLANGLHNIAWSVTDNQGRTDGVGIRYFNVFNPNPAVASVSLPRAETSSTEARFRTGFDTSAPLQPLKEVEVPELGRIEIALPAGQWQGHLIINEDRRELPAGSTLDPANGVFVWQLGPGFRGSYELVFESAAQAIPVQVHIGPRLERQ